MSGMDAIVFIFNRRPISFENISFKLLSLLEG
jgi:hypothetical protein